MKDEEIGDWYLNNGWEEDIDETVKEDEVVTAQPSHFVEFAFKVPGPDGSLINFDFSERNYLKAIYDSPARRRVILAGRQVEKSTLIGNISLTYMAMIPGFRVLYVSPSHTQTKVFSRDRIKSAIETSEYLKAFTNSKLLSNVLEKRFLNNSQVTLRFAFLNADRVRGIPADRITIDEFQDVLLDNVPVIEQCAFHSKWKMFDYVGTPKSMDGSLEYYWSRYSTQNEWAVPCRSHGTPTNPSSWHWNILCEDNIGPEGLICDRCGRPISSKDPDACWVALNPKPNVIKPHEGYRIPQIMVPWVDWGEILHHQKSYSRQRFYNEILGRSYDSGTRPLTRKDVMDNCNPKLSMEHYKQVAEKYAGAEKIFMGVDWGCHDDQTRILAEDGFKFFKDLKESDRVAQFEPETGTMTLVNPTKIVKKKWKGELLHFKAVGLDMMLTPDHRMMVQGKGATRWKEETAEDTAERSGQVRFKGCVDWEGEESSTFILPGVSSSAGYSGCSDSSIPMDTWLEFLGYCLTEGGLCHDKNEKGELRISCVKMSQRESVHPQNVVKMRECLNKLPLKFSEFKNDKTTDVNWTLYGKQLWSWIEHNVGETPSTKRIPRQFLRLSKRQLRILFSSMMLGDGSYRDGERSGEFRSTSKGLCEDFLELCIKLGHRVHLEVSREAVGNKMKLWRVNWFSGRDFVFNSPSKRVQKVPYDGMVYCCSVPTGFIITERNGQIAYQGNSSEGSYTVMVLGGYMPWDRGMFTFFYAHRFDGPESEPSRQIELIVKTAREFKVATIGVDYGGGYWPNDELVREFGVEKVKKYQWLGNTRKKIRYDSQLGVPRFLCHRSELMSDFFNAIKRRNVFRFPRWEEFYDPYGMDFLNIFSEYNERLRINIYKHAPGCPDDTAHACIYSFLSSMFEFPRPDVILPTKEAEREVNSDDAEDDYDDEYKRDAWDVT